jgi:hypothetical protein
LLSVAALACITALGDNGVSEGILAALSLSEGPISIIQADYHVTWNMVRGKPESSPGRLDQEGTYGYKQGKAYLSRYSYAYLEDGKPDVTFDQFYAFDGNVLRTLDKSLHNRRPSGFIDALEDEINMDLTPHTLLGRAIIPRGMRNLAELVAECKDRLHILENNLDISGQSCTLLEVIVPISVIGGAADESVDMTARIWVAPLRDYRMLKVEMYKSLEVQRKFLRYVIDAVELAQTGGAWLPVKARQTWYSDAPRPSGENDGDPIHMSARQTIEISQWYLPADIEDSKFTVEYPDGALVYDARKRDSAPAKRMKP